MYSLRAGGLRGGDDPVGTKIGVAARRGAEAKRFIGNLHMQCSGIGVG
ncbi:MAG: hypothetical protein K0S16_1443, partial [Moraxellaceae bacterium]|nr:hypothetical protein [Moraxellaceae bacterium]